MAGQKLRDDKKGQEESLLAEVRDDLGLDQGVDTVDEHLLHGDVGAEAN